MAGILGTPTFIGLGNFQRLSATPFRNALSHNFQLLIVLPIVTLGLSLFFAALFTQGGRGVRGAQFYRIVFFFPQVMSVVIIGVLWQYIYNPILGLLNGTLRAVGLDALTRPWLGARPGAVGGGGGRRLAGRRLLHGPLHRRHAVDPVLLLRSGNARRRQPLGRLLGHHRAAALGKHPRRRHLHRHRRARPLHDCPGYDRRQAQSRLGRGRAVHV